MAKSVGADFDKTMPTPILAAFSRTSDDILPLNTMTLSRTGILLFKQYPYILSSALCLPISVRFTIISFGVQSAALCTPSVSLNTILLFCMSFIKVMDSSGVRVMVDVDVLAVLASFTQ